MIIPLHNNIMSTSSETVEVGGQQSKQDTLTAATSDRRRSWLMSIDRNIKGNNFYTGLSGRSITMGAGDSTRSMLSIDLALRPEDFDGGLSELIMESADYGDANEIELLPSLPEYELQQQYSTRNLSVANIMADEYNERWASGLPEGEAVCGEQPCPVFNLTAKLKRVSTAERQCDSDILNEDFTVTSRDWGISSSSIKNTPVNRASNLERVCTAKRLSDDDILNEDFTVASRDWGMQQSSTQDTQNINVDRDWKNEFPAVVGLSSLFMNNTTNKSLLKRASSLSLEEEGMTKQKLKPTMSNENIANSSSYDTRSTSRVSNTASPTSSTKSSSKPSKSKPPRRVIDVSRSVEYTDDDVLLGRGGFTNTHPGNIRFREKALELRQLYESSDKEQKFEISKLLLGSVTDKGNRFLERGDDGLWHEVVGDGARKKASQALRERIKGSRR